MKTQIIIFPYGHHSKAHFVLDADVRPIPGNPVVRLRLQPENGEGKEVTLNQECRDMIVAFLGALPREQFAERG